MAPPISVPRAGDMEPTNTEIPFAVIENPPTTATCIKQATLAENKACFIEYVNDFINKPLRKYLDSANKNENQRIFVVFTIDRDGKATNFKIRAKDTAIESEILKIMEKFPQVTPGKQRGKLISTQLSVVYKS
jgi:protein TonB